MVQWEKNPEVPSDEEPEVRTVEKITGPVRGYSFDIIAFALTFVGLCMGIMGLYWYCGGYEKWTQTRCERDVATMESSAKTAVHCTAAALATFAEALSAGNTAFLTVSLTVCIASILVMLLIAMLKTPKAFTASFVIKLVSALLTVIMYVVISNNTAIAGLGSIGADMLAYMAGMDFFAAVWIALTLIDGHGWGQQRNKIEGHGITG